MAGGGYPSPCLTAADSIACGRQWEAFAWFWALMRFIEEVQQLHAANDVAAYWLDIYNQADSTNAHTSN